jgi:hypothetical protein
MLKSGHKVEDGQQEDRKNVRAESIQDPTNENVSCA